MAVVLAHKGTLLSVSLCVGWRLGTAVKVSGKMGWYTVGIGAVFII